MVFNACIPSRFRIGMLGMTACSLLYSLRVNLSVAIVAMVKQTLSNDTHPQDWCDDHFTNESQTNYFPEGQLDWSESVQGIVLGAYYYGFTATQITGGLLSERFGAKWVCGLGIGVPAIVNALSPLAANKHQGWLIFIRIIIGAFHGLVHSSLFSMYAKWFPTQERTIAIAATQFGGNIGAVFMSPIAGYLSNYGYAGGWPSVFYTSSVVHILWLSLWLYCAHDSPKDDKHICPEEHLYILQNTDSHITKSSAPIPWKSILTSRVVYASVLAKASGMFGYHVLSTNLPSYFNAIFSVKITENGLYTALMYLAIGITLMSAGPLSTFIIAKTQLSRTRIRKIFQMIALVGPAICLIIVPSVQCNLTAVVVLVVLTMCLYGFITGGEYPIIPEYAPEFTGIVFGFSNTLASSMGFLAPIIVGQVLDSNSNSPKIGTREKWNLVFYITAAIYLLGALVFELFGSAERQPWAKIPVNRNDIQLTDFNVISRNSNKNSQNKQSFSKTRIFSRFNRHKNNVKQMDTQTPEWIHFKRNNYVF